MARISGVDLPRDKRVEIGLLNLICADLGVTLDIQQMDFDSVLPGVQTGKYDVGVSGISVTPEREKNVLFTNPYCLAAQAIVVPEGSAITGKADLDGKTVAVQTGTTAESYCMSGGYTVNSYAANSDAQLALTTGKVDADVQPHAATTGGIGGPTEEHHAPHYLLPQHRSGYRQRDIAATGERNSGQHTRHHAQDVAQRQHRTDVAPGRAFGDEAGVHQARVVRPSSPEQPGHRETEGRAQFGAGISHHSNHITRPTTPPHFSSSWKGAVVWFRSHGKAPKSPTIYSENYTFLFHERNIWPKYAILSAFA